MKNKILIIGIQLPLIAAALWGTFGEVIGLDILTFPGQIAVGITALIAVAAVIRIFAPVKPIPLFDLNIFLALILCSAFWYPKSIVLGAVLSVLDGAFFKRCFLQKALEMQAKGEIG